MELRFVTRSLAVFASLAAVLCVTAGSAHAQVVGENINMVSGTQWPGGDPFLQRQNEPTMAVSSVNAQHLMAGANDYRSVDVPDPAYGEMAAGDAWLGVFKSLDGGQTWKSVLLPGYPQDTSAEGLASPLKAQKMRVPATFTPDLTKQVEVSLPGSADPVMRAGTDGMFYFLGINFARDRSVSRLFLGRFIDQNNKENGDATQGTDPIRYLDTRIIARSTDTALNGGKQIFIDKPWMAIDIPGNTTATCTVPDPDPLAATTQNPNPTKQILAGTIYVGWAQFAPGDVSSDIMLTWSSDCGVNWVQPQKLNTGNSKVNQGVTIAIEPISGRVYVAWRRVASVGQVDAIMATRSDGRKRHFAAPRVAARLIPFDLGTGLGQARTQTMPSLAISSDGTKSFAHIAWAARSAANGQSRVWMTNAQVYPKPVGDDDPDDPDDYEEETRVKWTTAAMVSVGDVKDDFGHVLTRGHQYMPALTASQGRLVLFYYDSRLDHTRRYYRPNPLKLVADPADSTGNNKISVWAPDDQGKFYQEELGPIGDLVEGPSASKVFGNVGLTPAADFDDTALTKTRHTVDVRVGMALPSLAPAFSNVLVSRFPFGITGEETNVVYPLTNPVATRDFTAAGFLAAGPDQAAKPGSILLVSKNENKVQVLQQLNLNPPGYPMFKGSSAAFMGDYIDVQGQNFAVATTTTAAGSTNRWIFNTAASRAPVFHAAWTSNQDVKTPPYDATGKPDWKKYTPVTLKLGSGAGGGMLYDGGRADPNISNTPVADCDPASTGSRDQNIYTARITEGLQVSTPQNSKILMGQTPVGFVIAASNSTSKPMAVTFGAPTGVSAGSFSYTTDFSNPVPSVANVQIAPYSSVYRTLFVRQGSSVNSAPTLLVSVTESSGCGVAGQPACRAGSLTFNPPIALNALVPPEGYTSQDARETYAATIGAPNISNPNISNPNISNPNISNPNISNPNISNPNISNPNISNPNVVANPNISNPNISNPNISNPNISNPNISNPNISNPNISNPNISNPNISNSALSDASYTFTNTGNTNATYFVKVVGDQTQVPSPLQLIVSKTYKTPTPWGCDLMEVAHDQVVVSVPDISKDVVGADTKVFTGVETTNISNATLSLAPGETATVTLRGYVPLTEMAKAVSAVTPAPVPASAPPTEATATTTYRNWGTATGNPPFVKTPTDTTITQSSTRITASVAVRTGYPWGHPAGSVTFVRSRAGVDEILGTVFIVDFGGDSPYLNTTSQAGDSFVAIYSGDATYAASSSNAVTTAIPMLQPIVGNTGIWAVGGAADQRIAQVVAGTGASIYGVRVPIMCAAGAVLTVEVQDTTLVAGVRKPNGVVRASKVLANAPALLPTPPYNVPQTLDLFHSIYFDGPVSGAGYFAIVFSATGNTCGIENGPVGDPYAGGDAFGIYTGVNWLPLSPKDIPFEVVLTPPVAHQLSVGVRAEVSGIYVWVSDLTANQVVDNAAVTLNGTLVPSSGSGGAYFLSYGGSAVPGSAINLTVTTLAGQVATVMGNYPGQPEFSTPLTNTQFLATNSLTVAWNNVADYYDLIPYCDPLANTNYVCPSGMPRVYAPNTSYTFPTNTFHPIADAQLAILAVNSLTFDGATAMGEAYAALPAIIHLQPVSPVLVLNATAGIGVANQGNGQTYRTFNVDVFRGDGTTRVPSSRLTVTLQSSSSTGNPVTIPAYTSGPEGNFSGTGGLYFGSGDTVTMVVTETDPTSGMVAQTSAQIVMPGIAHFTSATISPSGTTVTAEWNYPNMASPQEFLINPGSVSPAGSARSASFPAPSALPISLSLSSWNTTYAFSGIASGVFVGRTDDSIQYSVVPGP